MKSFSPIAQEQRAATVSDHAMPDRELGSSLLEMRWYFAFFVVSGFCSLLYEVVWLRLVMASFGVTTAMVSIVLSMFMSGLGFGSWGAGVLVRRGGAAPRMLRYYALAELLVGISALLVPNELKLGRVLLQAMSTSAAWQSSRYYVLSGGWVALALTPWCTCMGSTFPLLMAVIRQSHDLEANRSFSYLYVANVFGALLGTGMSAFVLIELLGFRGTLDFAAILNFALALTACCFSLTAFPVRSPKSAITPAIDEPLYGLPRTSSLWMLFTTGFVSMGLEVVWVRQFTPYLGNVIYAFAGILITYLLATFWGSQDYRSWAGSHNLEETAPSWTLLALFALIPLATADPLLPLRIGTLELGGWRMSAIVLFCALAGFLTPMLIDSWSVGDPGRAGTAYAINVSGSILGPLVAGFWLLPHLGERWASVALALPLFVVGGLTALRNRSAEVPQPRRQLNPRTRYAIVSVAAILLVSLSHDYERKFPEREIRRDYAATVIATGTGFDKQLLVNGVGMTKVGTITKYMAHLPLAFMNRPPRNGLVICFGMGTTFRSMLSWGIPTTGVDLVPSVPALFGYFHSDAKQLLSSPLSQVVVDDGRRFLDGSNQLYDVIVVDPPPPPEATGSSLLYSREFYEVIRKHLPPDGVFQIWFPEREAANIGTTASIAKALEQIFPNVRAFRAFDDSGIHFLASGEPLPNISAGILASRVPHAAAADFREWTSGVTIERLFSLVLANERPIEKMIAQDPVIPALEDDQPINEYYKLRSWFHYYR